MIHLYSNRLTCFGINNEGQLVFDYYHEDTDQLNGANVYNGQNSVLWNNFRMAFPDEIKETYQNLRTSGKLTFQKIRDNFITNHADKWSEAIYNEDAYSKYIQMLVEDNDATNLPQIRGKAEEHFEYLVGNRFDYCDSKWYAGDYVSNYVSLRIYTPSEWSGIEPNANITTTYFSNTYAGVRYKANGTLYQQKVNAGVPVTFNAPNETFNDTETAVYGAHLITSLGDLAPLYAGSINVAAAYRLIVLKAGDSTEGYSNPNLKEVAIGTKILLRSVNVCNCPNFTSALDLSACPNVEEVYATGSGITAVNLPEAGILRIAELPATITNLTLSNQPYIETLTLEGYDAIKTINIENCPTIDSLDILSKSTNVERVRLTDVDWDFDDTSYLYALIDRNLGGIDENGANTNTMWIDGKCHIASLTGAELVEIKEAFPYLTITYTNLTAQLIFMSEDGTTELCRQTINNGGNGINPITNGTITTPTKASTAQYTYTFAGWSLSANGSASSTALDKVEADRYVYVAFTATVRKYTVKFYNGTTLLQTVNNVPYGSSATYTGSTPTNNSTGNTADFEFYGWNPAPTNIQGDTNCYAQFYDLREITDDWATIANNVANGTATTKYGIGAFKTLELGAVYLPYKLYDGCAVVCNEEIHIMGGTDGTSIANTNHYKWNGTEWVSVSTLPYKFYGLAVVYNNEIHILGGTDSTTKHYKWNGSSWAEVSTLPYDFYGGSVVVYNNEIHILGGTNSKTNHYKWDGTEWVSTSTLPYEMFLASAIVYNNEIHILGSYSGSHDTKHYKWDGSTWTEVSTLPYIFNEGSAVMYNNEIHILGSSHYKHRTEHYKYDGSTWTKVSTLPYSFYYSNAIVCNGTIHMLGGNGDSGSNHYQYNSTDSSWIKFGVTESIPMEIVAHYHDELPDGVMKWESIAKPTNAPQYGCAVTYQKEVHVLGGNISSSYTQHIKWDDTNSAWVTVSTLPYQFRSGCAVILNDEIHILGSYRTTNKTEHYKWNATDGWVSVSTLPYSFCCSSAVVLNNEIHILGSYDSSNRKYHYKWSGTEWTSVSTLPYNFYYGSAVVYNGEIHIFSGTGSSTGHYKWDGSAWTSVSTLPYDLQYGAATIINNEIHIFGGNGNGKGHYKWDGTEWTSMTTLSGSFNNYPLAVCNDTPYIFISTSCYKLAGAEWVQDDVQFINNYLNTCPSVEYMDKIYLLKNSGGSGLIYSYDGEVWIKDEHDCSIIASIHDSTHMLVYDGCIHVMGHGSDRLSHCSFDGTAWTEVGKMPYTFVSHNKVAVYDGCIYALLSTNYIYKYDGIEWTYVSDTPSRNRTYASIGVYKNELHWMAGHDHYKWEETNTTWVNVSVTPIDVISSKMLEYNGELHVMSGRSGVSNNTYSPRGHFAWNGITWREVSVLPFSVEVTTYVVYRGHLYMGGAYNKYLHKLENPKASLTFVAKNVLKDSRKMNTTATSDGGWSETSLRSYLNGEFLTTLPSDLQTAITKVTKMSDGGYSNPIVVRSNDTVWVPSAEELGCDEQDYYISGQGESYSVFTDDVSRRRNRTTDASNVHKDYYTRTSDMSNDAKFVVIFSSGKIGNNVNPSWSGYHTLIGFCI